MEISWQLLILAALVSMAGSFIQSTTGFGYAVTVMAV
ncbi:secreted protein, partial [gut metagenome]